MRTEEEQDRKKKSLTPLLKTFALWLSSCQAFCA